MTRTRSTAGPCRGSTFRLLVGVVAILAGCGARSTSLPDGDADIDVDADTDADAGSVQCGPVAANGPLVDVVMSGLAFMPEEVDVTRGTTVCWMNYDAPAHTVTEGSPGTPTPLFDSPLLGAGEQWGWTFRDSGEFNYWCRTHPNIMRDAVVRVR